MTGGALYQVALASELRRRLGVTIKAAQIGFQIEGVPQALCRALSSRREKIKARLDERQDKSAIGAKRATLETRPKKVHISQGELRSKCSEIAKGFSWGEKEAALLIRPGDRQLCTKDELQKAYEAEREKIPDKHRSFGRLRGLVSALAVELKAEAEIARPLLEEIRRQQWGEWQKESFAQEKPSAQKERPKASYVKEIETFEGGPASAGKERAKVDGPNFDSKFRTEFHADEKARTNEKNDNASKSRQEKGQDKSGKEKKHREDRAFGSDRHKEEEKWENSSGKRKPPPESEEFGKKRTWTATRLAGLDPRRVEFQGNPRDLYAAYLRFMTTGELYAPVTSEPMRRTAAQEQTNTDFVRAFADKLDKIFPEKQTASRVIWHAVNIACELGADPWALFYTLRNITPAAERGFVHVETPKAFPKSPFARLKHFRPAKIALGEKARRWGDILWRKDIFRVQIRIQHRVLFSNAWKINPFRALKIPALRFTDNTKERQKKKEEKRRKKESLRAKESMRKSRGSSEKPKKEQTQSQSQ